MAVDQTIQKVQDALKLGDLKSKLPRNPKIVDIRVEDYVDTDGEDALRVWLILDEGVEVEKLTGDDISEAKDVVRDRIRELGIPLWPYLHMAKQSEFDEGDDEAEG